MLADFDGDGKMDIIVGTGNPMFPSGIGNPTHPFIIPTAAVLFGQGEATFLAAPFVRTGVNPLIAGADFDGDGIPDIAVADAFGNLTILKGKGNGEFLPVFVYNSPANVLLSEVALAVADFNHDGRPDVAMFVANSDVLVFLGRGDGTLAAPLVVAFPADTYYGQNYLGAVDLNSDGIPDLVVGAAGAASGVWVAFGKGNGTFTAPVLSPVTGPGQYVLGLGPEAYGALAFGDFNGDGKVDIAVGTKDAGQYGVTLLLGKGDGTFVQGNSAAIVVPKPELEDYLQSMVAVDLNRDGRLDLAATIAGSDDSLETAILIGNGDGTFQTPTVFPVNATSVATADMNGDGIPDLVLSGAPSAYTQYPTVVLFGNGNGTFQPATQISSNASGNLLIADF
jgi:hypothetical protein